MSDSRLLSPAIAWLPGASSLYSWKYWLLSCVGSICFQLGSDWYRLCASVIVFLALNYENGLGKGGLNQRASIVVFHLPRSILLVVLAICLNATFLLEQPHNSVLDFYPRWRWLEAQLMRISGIGSVPGSAANSLLPRFPVCRQLEPANGPKVSIPESFQTDN